MRKREAYLDQFKKEALFSDSLGEFDESKGVVEELIQEYKAATKEDYLQWGINKGEKSI